MHPKTGCKQSCQDTESSDRSIDIDSFKVLDDAIRAANHADLNISGDFGQIMEDFLEVSEQVDKGVNDAFANILGSNLQHKSNDKAVLN